MPRRCGGVDIDQARRAGRVSAVARGAGALLLVLAGAACGGDAAGPLPEPPFLLELKGSKDLILPMGESVTLAVEARARSGALLEPAPESYVWTTSDPEVATVTAQGVVQAGATAGRAWVAVRASETAADSALIRVPSTDPALIATLDIEAARVTTLTRGEAATFGVDSRDASGTPVLAPADGYTWSSTRPEVARVAVGGVVETGAELGAAWIVARAASGATDSALVWVQPPEEEPSPFRIMLIFADDVPELWRTEMAMAAQSWERVIRGLLPEVTLNSPGGDCSTGVPPSPPMTGVERGVRIYVNLGELPGVEAIGGLCLQRPLPHATTILGQVALERDLPPEQIDPARLTYLAHHEMGHALGLVGILQESPLEWQFPGNGRYTGLLAIEGYRREFGVDVQEISVQSGHWVDIEHDVMLYGLNITPVSIGALMDLGYPAAWYPAR